MDADAGGRCHDLKHVNLEECQQVSDVGVLSLSNHCHGLETINLSRTNLLFKITDVSLLAFGERCPALQVKIPLVAILALYEEGVASRWHYFALIDHHPSSTFLGGIICNVRRCTGDEAGQLPVRDGRGAALDGQRV